jgi:hypothetical protein
MKPSVIIEIAGFGVSHGEAVVMQTSDEKAAQRLMSASAESAYDATRFAVADATWRAVETLSNAGMFMGVGASGSDLGQLQRILVASFAEGNYSNQIFGDRGLRACNPLFAFQLMNNFVMANAAMLVGTRGPHAVLFSRGAGTALALDEAMAALREGDCRHALVGGADAADHRVTILENWTTAKHRSAYRPRRGAGVIALETVATATGRWRVEAVQVTTRSFPRPSLAELFNIRHNDDVYVDGWCDDAVRDVATSLGAVASIIRTGPGHDTLAAGPAIAWCSALQSSMAAAIVVVHVDINGDISGAKFTRGTAGGSP